MTGWKEVKIPAGILSSMPTLSAMAARPVAIPSYLSPLDEKIADRVTRGLYRLLTDLGFTHVLDPDAFIASRGYKPDISSIFITPHGGSFDFDDNTYGHVVVQNGS